MMGPDPVRPASAMPATETVGKSSGAETPRQNHPCADQLWLGSCQLSTDIVPPDLLSQVTFW